MEQLNVTVWNEYIHEKSENIAKIYPNGIHGAIAEMLGRDKKYNIRTATLDMPENGLPKEVLDNTDVLIWWGHCAHDRVLDEVALRVKNRVLDGMGFIVLHSGHRSKPFVMLMGTSCRLKWRENDEKERLWLIAPSHPIANKLPEFIELEQEETYGEFFDIPTPDELIFISWFAGGDIFRSGCCYKRGRGKIFYFRPGHEEYPTFYREDISQIIKNTVDWAAPQDSAPPSYGYEEAIEKIPDKFEGMSDSLRKHVNISKI